MLTRRRFSNIPERTLFLCLLWLLLLRLLLLLGLLLGLLLLLLRLLRFWLLRLLQFVEMLPLLRRDGRRLLRHRDPTRRRKDLRSEE